MTAVPQLDAAELTPLQRQANRALMVSWINADLRTRAHLDVRTAVVLYDGDKMFEYALAGMPDEHLWRELRSMTNVRFWSKGI